ncbi:bifunctional 3,4-dihydroxy-2-butanone-4-phosphate synthase/GTP cyclohydrolase II [soil metagenome]
MPFAPIPEILAELRAGRMVVLTDDERRENEGDLVLPAQFVTPAAITFLLSKGLGYLCLALPEEDCDRLDLPPQAAVNTTLRGTAFTVSIDPHPRHGGTTGVSAGERAKCIRLAIDPASTPGDFLRPGHINPLRSRTGGVLVRTGQTEGSVDLCRLAGLTPAAAIIEIMKPDGEMARLPDLERFCAEHKLKMCSVAQIIQHRLAAQPLVRRLEPHAGELITTELGVFRLFAYESLVDALPHIALTVGDVGLSRASGASPSAAPTLVRMHRRHLLGDVFDEVSAAGRSSGSILHAAMRAIQAEGRGAIVYLRQEGPAGAAGDLESRLQHIRRGAFDAGSDAADLTHARGHAADLPATLREFGIGGQILRDLGVQKMRLLTNSSTELPGLDAFGLEIIERVAL